MEINCLKSKELGKMKYISKISKGEQKNYFGKDLPSFLKIMKDNIMYTDGLTP